MQTTHSLTEKWAKVLDFKDAPSITDAHRRQVTATLLENQLQAMKADAKNGQFVTMLNEAGDSFGDFHGAAGNVSGIGSAEFGAVPAAGPNADPTVDGFAPEGGKGNSRMAGYDPVLINLVRRAMPQLIAFDVCGVQPMTSPTGLIFAMKSRYGSQKGKEALYNEPDTSFSGKGEHKPEAPENGWGTSNWAEAQEGNDDWKFDQYDTGVGMNTYEAETRGAAGQEAWNQMAFSIEKTAVVAKSRVLKAEYTLELAQDLKAVHGLDAEAELSNILATEILGEINREIIRDIYITAEWGAQNGTARKGVFDLDVDSDGRWSAEKYKGLMYRIEREANAIAQKTRRGRGNFIICSSDVAAALQMAGMLDYAPAVQNALKVDESASTFAGILNGKYKVFIDPYTANQSDKQYCVVGYKGTSAYDAGMFYCPYVPLQLVRASDPNTFQPKIGFKTRYGIAYNPMVQLDAGLGSGEVQLKQMANKNYYYRKFIISSL